MRDYPNVMIVPTNEDPQDIIDDYVDIIKYNVERERGIDLEDILFEFFDDVNRWTAKQFLIDLAGESLQELENINEIENEFTYDENEIDFEGGE